jgi:hypothetical protein
MTTQLNAAELKHIRQFVLWTINDTGVGVRELSRWVVRSKKAHREALEKLSAGYSKRNQALGDSVFEAVQRLAKAIERMEAYIDRETASMDAYTETQKQVEPAKPLQLVPSDFNPRNNPTFHHNGELVYVVKFGAVKDGVPTSWICQGVSGDLYEVPSSIVSQHVTKAA